MNIEPKPDGQPNVGERIVASGTLIMAAGAFLGHWLCPERIAAWYRWPPDRWYQREIAAFNAGIGYGVIELLRGKPERAFLKSSAISASALAATRASALARGARTGPRNLFTVIGDTALGVGALWALRRRGTQARTNQSSLYR